jgi:hypothetical protein
MRDTLHREHPVPSAPKRQRVSDNLADFVKTGARCTLIAGSKPSGGRLRLVSVRQDDATLPDSR